MFDGVTFEMFLDAVGRPPALQHQLRPVALPAAAARLSRLHRHLPRAHQGVPRQGCRVQPDRAAGRLFGLPAAGSTAPAASARSATARSISAAIFSKLAAVRLRQLGGARMGMLPEASRGRRRRRAPSSSSTTSSASPRRRSTISPAARPIRSRPGGCWASDRGAAHDDRGEERMRAAAGQARSGSAWSAAGRAPSSARVHRIAARIDDQYELVAGALVVQTRAGASAPARELGLDRGRAATPTSRRWRRPRPSAPDGIEAVSIVTPNHMHCAGGQGLPRRPASTSSATSR